jgi:ATP-dependent DNA helicase RecQ
MVQRQPTTLQEFSSIVGVGQAKLARYGAQFVDLIQRQSDGSSK